MQSITVMKVERLLEVQCLHIKLKKKVLLLLKKLQDKYLILITTSFLFFFIFFFSSRRRHTRCGRDWSSDVCSSDLIDKAGEAASTKEIPLSSANSTVTLPVAVCLSSSSTYKLAVIISSPEQPLAV